MHSQTKLLALLVLPFLASAAAVPGRELAARQDDGPWIDIGDSELANNKFAGLVISKTTPTGQILEDVNGQNPGKEDISGDDNSGDENSGDENPPDYDDDDDFNISTFAGTLLPEATATYVSEPAEVPIATLK